MKRENCTMKKEDSPIIIMPDMIDKIYDPAALGIYVYLRNILRFATKPITKDNAVESIIDRFGISSYEARLQLNYLCNLNLGSFNDDLRG